MSKFKRYERYKDSGVEWIGQVPNHWKVLKIKRLTRVKRGASPRPIDDPVYFDDDGEFSWVRISDVTTSKMYLNESTEKLSALGASLSVKLTPGQLFISICATVGKPCITKIKCCIHDGFVYFPDFKDDNRFLYYIFEAGEAYKGLGKLGTQLNLNTDTVGDITIGLPPLNEQAAIANFLDQKTAEIDGLIADKEKLIELLQEKRQAIISEVVTKGFNPNVKMKDSGVEWIGEIPEHWELQKIKYVANIRNVKASELDNDKVYIGLENIESKTGKLLIGDIDEQQNIEGTSNIFEVNDVLFGKLRPYLAKCIIANFSGRCTSELLVLRCSQVLPKYMFFLMLSEKFIDVVNSSTYGAKMPRANWDFIGNLKIPLPNKEEQKKIIEFLSKKSNEIDDLVSKIKEQIQKLKEYRQSLISEAVTGKIDVRDYNISN
jgi:restriction endonuclease S subunit